MRALRKLLSPSRRRSEQGSMSAELVLLAPFMLALALFVIACGRIGIADISVQNAANAAARDASLSRTASSAQLNANTSTRDSIAAAGLKCAPLAIDIDSSALNGPIGQVSNVRATITCTLNLADIALPGLPGTKVISSTATSPVDPYRERK